jgi:UDP-glucose 4-epimerase
MLVDEHDLCIVDSQRYGVIRLRPEEVARLRWEQEDIRDRSAMQRIINGFSPDVIIHLAAIHFIPECENDPELATTTNVVGTSNLASLCPPGCRFVFASSGAVYAPECHPHHEIESPLLPSDVYGWSKLHGEHYVRYFAEKRKFPACIVRLFNVIGPGETNPHVLPEIVAQLKANRHTLKLGNLDARRDYVHVTDVARGFANVACRGDVEPGETCVVNLGTQKAYSVHDLLEHLRTISAIDFQVDQDPSRMRASDRPFLAANNQQIAERFGWSPRFEIDKALADLWQNPDLPESWVDRYR